jgi:hypothetical protein
MNDDSHDDGLVHSHGWAMEPPPSVGRLLRSANDDGRIANPDVARAMAAKQDEAHDDGLVHGHDWASQHGARRVHG